MKVLLPRVRGVKVLRPNLTAHSGAAVPHRAVAQLGAHRPEARKTVAADFHKPCRRNTSLTRLLMSLSRKGKAVK